MRSLPYLAVGAAMALAIGLLTGDGWPAVAGGAILALSLFFMLSIAAAQPGWPFRLPDVSAFACGAVLTAVVGAVIGLLAVPGLVWYAPGAILSGTLIGAKGPRPRSSG